MDLTTQAQQAVRNLAGVNGAFASASVQTWPVSPGPSASAFAQGPNVGVVQVPGGVLQAPWVQGPWGQPPWVQVPGPVAPTTGAWWPVELGWPATAGEQNQVGYAYFPSMRRLAIRVGREVRIYDTGDHAIGGVFPPQGGDRSLAFASQYGLVRPSDLAQVWPANTVFAPSLPPVQATPPVISREEDVFAAIEKLAVLREKNILSEEEFSTKKAELLSRL